MSGEAIITRTIIGLEIHVQLKTQSKMFCGCPVRFEAPPNSCVCPVCLGHPGALPVMNARAFDCAVLAGMALNCTIARHTKWDRKSYYYPDLPKNYQITQYDLPLAEHGFFDLQCNGNVTRIRIKRAHLEEDAGKNLHDVPGCTLVDLNRAGTPLLEIVTEPDLTSADQAFEFCTDLQRLIVYLGVTEGSMQKGQMRFEPNVNVAIEVDGKELRTPISEIKNLNSFRAVRSAIAYEAKRQVAAWEEDPDYLQGQKQSENRGWNDDKGVTEFQRGKEAAHDYRYFPDPDLVPVEVSDAMLEGIRANLPELPGPRIRRFIDEYGLSPADADTIVSNRATADLFEEVIAAGGPPDIAGKQFVNVWLSHANDRSLPVTLSRTGILPVESPGHPGSHPIVGVDAQRMAQLASITAEGKINKTAAKRIAEAMLTSSAPPADLAKELGLVQVHDAGATAAWVEQAFAANEQAVQDAVANPKKAKAAAGFLRGQVMKISAGKADPKLVGDLIDQRLQHLRPDP